MAEVVQREEREEVEREKKVEWMEEGLTGGVGVAGIYLRENIGITA